MSTRLQQIVVMSLAAIAIFVAGAETKENDSKKTAKPSEQVQQIARMGVTNELMRLHWISWVTGKELEAIASKTAAELNAQFDSRVKAEFLYPEVQAKRRKLSAFENQAIKDIRAGVTKVWGDVPNGLQYVRGIRATSACIQCHRPVGSPADELMEGDLLGIISLRVEP